jgi:Cu(I)/Ag(I) efflux system membrane fusion protein
MNKIVISLATLLLIGVIGIYLYPKFFHSTQEQKIQVDSVHSAADKGYYTCPMHPSIHQDHPGACPICGMTLVKKMMESSLVEEHVTRTQSVSASRQVLANVETTPARRIALKKEIHAVGTIDYAEPNVSHISMRFAGRVDELYLTYTGQYVKKGSPVADVYSPDAISAEQEYLLAKDSYEQVKDAAETIASGAQSLLQQSREKLLLWGFTEDQIKDLEQTKKVKNTFTISSPISGIVLKKNVDPQQYVPMGENLFDVADLSVVWMYVDVYEYELQSVKVGQTVKATVDGIAGEVFNGTITFINPTLDQSSRTVRVRVEFPNTHEKLKPGMFANATISVNLSPAIVVPLSAVLSTGQRKIVWVEKQDGVFEMRSVHVGAQSDSDVQILEGISEGESVVSSGGYLIDSESQLEIPSRTSSDAHKEMNMN